METEDLREKTDTNRLRFFGAKISSERRWQNLSECGSVIQRAYASVENTVMACEQEPYASDTSELVRAFVLTIQYAA